MRVYDVVNVMFDSERVTIAAPDGTIYEEKTVKFLPYYALRFDVKHMSIGESGDLIIEIDI